MQWLELSMSVPRELVEPVSELFHRYGHGGVSIEEPLIALPEGEEYAINAGAPVVLRTYLPWDAGVAGRKARIEQGLWALSLITPLPGLQERLVAEEDWAQAWKAHFATFRVGRGTVIRPPWQDYHPQESEVVITLDPGMAFGTGLHPTTRMCLEALERLVQPGMRVLDVGTGSGVLALVAARLGAQCVLALDTDAVAVQVARANVETNGLQGRISVHHGSLPLAATLSEFAAPFDMVLANLTARILLELADPLMDSLAPEGIAMASGILDTRLNEVISRLSRAGARMMETLADADWRTVIARRRTG